MMLNIKSFDELKEKVLAHTVDWGELSPKDQRRFREHYKLDKEILVKKIDLIADCKDKEKKYEVDIVEILERLKKMGKQFIFLEEHRDPEKKEPISPVFEGTERKDTGKTSGSPDNPVL